MNAYDRGVMINEFEALKSQIEIDLMFVQSHRFEFMKATQAVVADDFYFDNLRLIKEFKEHAVSLVKHLYEMDVLVGNYEDKYNEALRPKLFSKMVKIVSFLPFFDDDYYEMITKLGGTLQKGVFMHKRRNCCMGFFNPLKFNAISQNSLL
jgi:hypothetical protein